MASADDFPPFLRALKDNLPPDLAVHVASLCQHSQSNALLLDNITRFVSGAGPGSVSKDTSEVWSTHQPRLVEALRPLLPIVNGKRASDDSELSSANKKRKLDVRQDPSPSDSPIFTLHAVSTTSPLRKKVDIVVHTDSIQFYNPTSHVLEVSIPTASLLRAFIVPTRGKQKAHWTVVVLSSDDTPSGTNSKKPSPNQIIFGIDAQNTTPMKTTDHATDSLSTTPKGSETLPLIRSFFSHLPTLQVLEPSTSHFKSAVTPSSPGFDAYLGAKQGTLWFFDKGILWGESKPCEFWALEELILPSKGEPVRLVSATGRMCSVIVTRKPTPDEVDDDEDEQDQFIGHETQFSMVDGREQDHIRQWVKQRRHLFGGGENEKAKIDKGKQKEQVNAPTARFADAVLSDNSDMSDDDFVGSESSDDLASSDSSSSESEDGSGNEEEAAGSDDEGDQDSDGELDAKHHPLMRPGAMPRISKAAMDMAVGMVEADLMGTADEDMLAADEDEEDEVDELDS